MKGTILSATRSSICECGGKFVSTQNPLLSEISFPQCNKCQSIPKKLRVKKSVPNYEGKSESIFIYSSLEGAPFRNLPEAVAVISHINEELRRGIFDFSRWGSNKTKQMLLVENFAEIYLKAMEERTNLDESHEDYLSFNWFKEKRMYIQKHIVPFFKGTSLPDVQKGNIKEFYKSYKTKLRSRSLAVAELRCFLKYAAEEHEPALIEKVPVFPKLQAAKKVRKSKVISLEDQRKIILNIKKPAAQAMCMIGAVYPVRPGEVRDLRAGDFDIEKRQFTVSRHLTDSKNGGEKSVLGRKSIGPNDDLSEITYQLDEFLFQKILPYIIGKDPEEHVFKGKSKAGHFSETYARKAWRASADELGFFDVPMYQGTKTATMSFLVEEFGEDKLQNYSHHKTKSAMQRYTVGRRNSPTLELVDTKRFQEESA